LIPILPLSFASLASFTCLAGLQLGALLKARGLSYLVVEKSAYPGSYFSRIPRHRQLISINKAFTGTGDPEFNLRHDWHTLVSPGCAVESFQHSFNQQSIDVDSVFGDIYGQKSSFEGCKTFTSSRSEGGVDGLEYDRQYYPNADALVAYLGDYALEHEVKIRYNTDIASIVKSKDGGLFELTSTTGIRLVGKKVILATGLFKENLVTMPGADLISTYNTFDPNPSVYRNKSVLILGKGNAGLETANSLAGEAQHIHVISRSVHKMSWQTRYPGNLRAVNNDFLDTINFGTGNKLGEIDLGNGDYAFVKKEGTNQILLVTKSDFDLINSGLEPIGNKLGVYGTAYDTVISCLGWRYDASIFPNMDPKPATTIGCVAGACRFPELDGSYQSSNIPGLYVAGTIAHSRDFRRAAGGVVDGFRHVVEGLANILHFNEMPSCDSWPFETVRLDQEGVEPLLNIVLQRANRAAGLYLMFGEILDLAVVTADQQIKYYSSVPKGE
jgi:hypothetical protein